MQHDTLKKINAVFRKYNKVPRKFICEQSGTNIFEISSPQQYEQYVLHNMNDLRYQMSTLKQQYCTSQESFWYWYMFEVPNKPL